MLLSPFWLPVLPKLLIVSNCLLNAQIRMSSYSREFKQFTLLLPYSFSMFFSFARWKAQSCLFMKNEKEKLHVNLNLCKGDICCSEIRFRNNSRQIFLFYSTFHNISIANILCERHNAYWHGHSLLRNTIFASFDVALWFGSFSLWLKGS